MPSLYLNRLNADERNTLVHRLLAIQSGNCFICQLPIDLDVHGEGVDIDHVIPLKPEGKDSPENFALTHSSCNRSKQASDLRVARVLATFDRIKSQVAFENRS